MSDITGPPILTAAQPFGPSGATQISKYEDKSLFRILKANLGWTPEYLAEINDPSHEELLDVDLLANELRQIFLAGEQIVVMPDFDMDGVTSGVLGWAGLNELGFDAKLYVPDYRRGHDVTVEAVDEAFAQFPSAKAMITCDGGVNSHPGIQRMKDLGLKALVTDHHVQLDQNSPADVIVDPERIDETYAHPGICGAFVFYQSLVAYAARYEPGKLGAIRLLKLFAGIGTVSDVMPLFYENRQVVKDSLSIARLLYHSIPDADLVTEYDVETTTLMMLLRAQEHAPEYVSVFEGFAVALRAFREHGPLFEVMDREGRPMMENGAPMIRRKQGKLRSMSDLTEEFYAFYMAPAFNAIRRVGGSMHDAFGVFTADTPEQKLVHAQNVLDTNEFRKEQTKLWVEKLDEEDQPLADRGVWLTDAPTGMLGLLASNLMRERNGPVVVVRRPSSTSSPVGGSARAPHWFKIISTLTPFGFVAVGHENACGVRAKDMADLVRLADTMEAQAQSQLASLIASGALAAEAKADLVLGPEDDCDAELFDVEEVLLLSKGIDSIAPFGHGFPRPEIDLVVDLARCSIGVLGKDESHLKIVLPIGMKLLWWGEASRLADLKDIAASLVPGHSIVRFRTRLSVNVFMGNESVQATIESMQAVDPDGLADDLWFDDDEGDRP